MPISRIRQWAETKPDALALSWGDVALSYRQFLAAISGFQQHLLRHTDRREGVAVIVTRDLLDAWLMSLAARALGLDAILVPRFDMLPMLALRNVSAIFSNSHEEHSAQAREGGAAEPAAIAALPHFTRDHIIDAGIAVADRFGSQILFTTGTTGIPKKVVVDGRVEEMRNQYRCDTFGFDASTVIYTDLPPFCGPGLKSPSAAWHAGGAVVLDVSLELAANHRRHGVNCVLAGPNQLQVFLDKGPYPPGFKDSFRIFYTSGPLPYELARLSAEMLSRHIHIYYGATELTGRILRSTFSDRDDVLWLTPEPGRDIFIMDERGGACPRNVEGRLAIKLCAADAEGYLDDPQTSARIFRNGYFVPGDLAIQRDDGRIRVLGREADVINIRGTKRPLLPLEATIQSYLGAAEVCVFLELNTAGQEEALVAMRVNRDITREEMNHIAQQYLPFEIVRYARLSQFPKSDGAFGKTLRGELRKLLHAARG